MAFLLGLMAVAASSCGTQRGGDAQTEANLDPDFVAAVATARALDVPVYWLGQEFAVGGLVFRGPDVVDFDNDVEATGIGMTYIAPVDDGNTGLDLTVYGRDAWELVKERVTNPRTPGASRRSVSVLGKDAEMFSAPGGTRPLNALWLILDLGDAVVVATVNSGGPAYAGGPDYNPLINSPDLFVQVIEENLRPYPE
jgi:hypothetical protein